MYRSVSYDRIGEGLLLGLDQCSSLFLSITLSIDGSLFSRFQDKKALHKSDSKKRAALGFMFEKGHFSLFRVGFFVQKGQVLKMQGHRVRAFNAAVFLRACTLEETQF